MVQVRGERKAGYNIGIYDILYLGLRYPQVQTAAQKPPTTVRHRFLQVPFAYKAFLSTSWDLPCACLPMLFCYLSVSQLMALLVCLLIVKPCGELGNNGNFHKVMASCLSPPATRASYRRCYCQPELPICPCSRTPCSSHDWLQLWLAHGVLGRESISKHRGIAYGL